MHFYQTQSHAIVLHNTQPAACSEKAVCMKTQEELYQKVRLTGCVKSNSQCGQQDLRGQDARSSWDPPSDSKSYEETSNNAVDFRIPGIPLSTVEQQDTTRENKVKKLIEKFENHQHKESFLQDFSQTQKINKFRKESQESRRAVARVYVCALLRIWCGAVYISSLVLCPFCVRGAAGRHGGGRNSPPNPKGVTPALPLSHSVDRVGCGVSSEARASLGVGSTTLSLSSARRWIHDPQPFQCTALDPRPSAFPVHGVGSTTLSVVKISRPINPTGIVGPLLPWSLWKRETKNCTCNQRATTQDDVTSMSSLAMVVSGGETAGDHQGDT